MCYIDNDAKSQQRAQHDEIPPSNRAACISEFLDLCIPHLGERMTEEARYHQEQYDSMMIRLREIKGDCKSMSEDGNGTATFIYNKLKWL